MSLEKTVEARPVNLEAIQFADLPVSVTEYLSSRPVFELRPEFNELLVAHHANGVSSYVAHHAMLYDDGDAGVRPWQYWYITDTNADGEIVGQGEMTLAPPDGERHLSSKPYVSWLGTHEEHRGLRRGNLVERLLVMREIAETKLDSPLYADVLLSPDAVKVLRRCMRAGLVETVEDPGSDDILYRSVRRPSNVR